MTIGRIIILILTSPIWITIGIVFLCMVLVGLPITLLGALIEYGLTGQSRIITFLRD